MKILTTVFNYKEKPYDYEKMHEVFLASCKKHMPDVEVVTLSLTVPLAKDDRKPGLWTNTCKLKAQAEYVENVDDDLAIMDCDMLILKSIEDVFKIDFDIGYTVKPKEKKTQSNINGGVVFVKNTPKAKEWFRKLNEINQQMYYDPIFHNEWRKKYFGMNQSAMGFMTETKPTDAKVKRFQTKIWNAVDCDWIHIDETTRAVHIKGKLRRCIFSHAGYEHLAPIMREWYSYTGNDDFNIVEKMPWDIRATRRKHHRRSGVDVRNG